MLITLTFQLLTEKIEVIKCSQNVKSYFEVFYILKMLSLLGKLILVEMLSLL